MLFQYLYTFSRFAAESWLYDMLRSALFLPKNVNDFFAVKFRFLRVRENEISLRKWSGGTAQLRN